MASGPRVVADCFMCKKQYQSGPQIYTGRTIKAWEINVCDACHSGNWDGIAPETHPRLIAHLRKRGIPVNLNANGWIDWPRSK